jgi:Arc/MetJ-type ribon-helix-helix transcriptional regulator
MQITLPPEAQAIIDREVESGRYASEVDVIVEALKHLDEHSDIPYVDNSLLILAREQADRGETRVLTEQVMEELLHRARESSVEARPVRDEVKY